MSQPHCSTTSPAQCCSRFSRQDRLSPPRRKPGCQARSDSVEPDCFPAPSRKCAKVASASALETLHRATLVEHIQRENCSEASKLPAILLNLLARFEELQYPAAG